MSRKFQTEPPTLPRLLQMYRHNLVTPSRLAWATRCTRWDVYPNRETIVLAFFNYEGTWLPQPGGTWYKSSSSYIALGDAHAPELFGEWINVHDSKLMEFVRADDALRVHAARAHDKRISEEFIAKGKTQDVPRQA